MKTRFLRSWKLVIVLAGLPLADGTISGPGFIATAEETAPVDVPTTAPATQTTPPPLPPQTVPALPDVKLSPGAAEIAKLAQAGLGEDVMLAYVGNVNGTFNLGSDQILYLNDLGVSGTVVKAMIQRDAQYSADAQAWAAANQPPVTPQLPLPSPSDDGSYTPAPTDNSMALNPDDMAGFSQPGDYSTTDDSSYFYNSLAPYGSWIYLSGAGLCWQPTVCVASHEWRPYFDRGRWMFSDCGWYWRSDYSWGWAAFHYGRWFNDNHRGWVWRPDHVWGPAWVSWRHSDDYCGWAPLPPSAHFVPGIGFQHRGHTVPANFDFGLRSSQYTFIPVGRMTDYSPYRYAAAPWKLDELYRQSAVVNHVTFEHNHVVSHGIDPKEVAMASGIPIRPAEIHETSRRPNNTVLSEHLAKQGDSLMIFRPQLSSPGANTRPRQFMAPPAKGSGAPKTSLNNSAPISAPPLPVMNFASAAPASQGTKAEFYPSGSFVVLGEKTGGNSQTSIASHLPNMNFAHVASPSTATYASVPPRESFEPSTYYYPETYGRRPAAQPLQTQQFDGYRQQLPARHDQAGLHFAPNTSPTIIGSHLTVGSRLENHSAYTFYDSAHPEPVSQHHSFESGSDVPPAHHSAYTESHAASHSEHFTEHSASAAVSHSSSPSSPASSSPSGHR